MKTRVAVLVALLLFATCDGKVKDPITNAFESSNLALGAIPASEIAVWKKVGSSNTPEARYLHAAAFDSARGVVVLFGGTNLNPNYGTATPNQETWEWNPTTGAWTNRTSTGNSPDARSGAAMVYDSVHKKFVLFGGRAGSGFNYEDTWEWDPSTGLWTEISQAGSHPSARSQHSMVYEPSTGKILLFGGGRSDSNSYDATGITLSMGDTWELDPATKVWTLRSPATAPTSRHDVGMVWDSVRNRAVLFGGIQVDLSGASGIPKQDIWEWDPQSATWTERSSLGARPGPRYAHSMAFDGNRGKVVVFGGFDMSTGGNLNDVWDWDPTTGAWLQRMTGDDAGMPSARRYATLIADDVRKRLELVAGLTAYNPYEQGGTGGIIIMPPGMFTNSASKEVWELDPATQAFTDRTGLLDMPMARTGHAMAYYPPTGKFYIFGGSDLMTGRVFDDLWAWDGETWTQIVRGGVRPTARVQAAMAYDPSRKSLILFGGDNSRAISSKQGISNETWEWTDALGWKELLPPTRPDPLTGHGMVTDTTRLKILLFGGMSEMAWGPFVDGGFGPIYREPMRNEVWEWDGTALTWTNRTPPASSSSPTPRQQPLLTYDEAQKKLFLFDGENFGQSMNSFWLWDPLSAGWSQQSTNETSKGFYPLVVGYDSIRKRQIFVSLISDFFTGRTANETWELDVKNLTWYARSISSPAGPYASTMSFDSARGVMVLFGGSSMKGVNDVNELWEYSVTGIGNGTGCSTTFASSCASGHCVDGVCCESAACTGPCKSCNVTGSEGTCVAAKAGTEVPGSCSNGQACDGNGNCMAGNGQACTSGTQCASDFCVDGVCCDSGCGSQCMACNQPGRMGQCSPFAAGTDPQGECGKGSGICKSTCDGVGNCAFPQTNVTCGNCLKCDGYGMCTSYDPFCRDPFNTGGSIDPIGGMGGIIYVTGGAGGYVFPTGGFTGVSSGGGGSVTGTGGMTIPVGGTGGNSNSRGGAGGTVMGSGGMGGGFIPGTGGAPRAGGAIGSGGSSSGRGGNGGSISRSGGSIAQGGNTLVVGGSGGKLDAGPTGGGGRRDGSASEITDPNLTSRFHHSGCSCKFGQSTQAGSGVTLPLLTAALGLALLRFRRRK